MKKVFHLFGKEFDLPWLSRITTAVQSFSFTEKIIFGLFAIIFVLSSLLMLLQVNTQFLIEVPRFGGTLHEGVIGTPRFINPIIAISETDRDLSSLVYSGLMRIAPDGSLIPDLALDYTVSEDGLEYLFTIRGDAVFHDGHSVTADDVVFTVTQTTNPAIKSAQRANWEGVAVEKVSENEVRFILPQPYAPFLFNTTLGILPAHIWQEVPDEEFAFSEKNVSPTGSGPYKIADIKRNASGIAERYTLTAFNNFTLGKPYIETIVFSFYRNEALLISALRTASVDAVNSISPQNAEQLAETGFRVNEYPLPRIFAVFFNQSQAPILASKEVRKALSAAIDREAIIEEVLAGYGVPAQGPIPESLLSLIRIEEVDLPTNRDSETESAEGAVVISENLSSTEQALHILTEAGFTLNDAGFMERETEDGVELLTLTISTADIPELVAVAEKVVGNWTTIGVDVDLKIFDPNDFNQNVIRPRHYDAMFFGEIIGRDLDFYAFWHSSQRNDPGLNIADYANIDVDTLLEEARTAFNSPDRTESLRLFAKEVATDVPAAFIYSPDFIYVLPKSVEGIIPDNLATPAERFLQIYNWYLETDTVWKIFN